MSAPLETPEFGNLYLGDTSDDDAAVIEAYTNPASDGPPNVQTSPIPDQSVLPPVVKDRLLCETSILMPTWSNPTIVQPADPGRTMFMCKAISATATDFVSISDGYDNLQSTDGGTTPPKLAGRIYPSDGWVNLGPYTGPIFASAIGSVGNIYLSWMAVTK